MDNHGGSLRKETDDDVLTRQIMEDFRKADIDARTMRMLEYSEKLTLHPKEMSEADLTPMREEGMTDEDIFDVVQIVGYFNYTNRRANGLGVDPDAEKRAR